jgi:hypothetical protein
MNRFGCTEEDAKKYIKNFIKVLEEQSPDDWRFTRSPVAKFLIFDQESGFHILGRTYREAGIDFLKKLSKTKLDKKNIDEDEKGNTVKDLANEYLTIIQTPNARIMHELKTIYKKDMDIGELKHYYKLARKDLPHLIPVNAKKVAARPNAIVTKDSELWVRQKELIKIPQQIDYLFFERLTEKGIDKSNVRIYSHDNNCKIVFVEEYTACKESMTFDYQKKEKMHTSSYWSLPTYVDAVYIDLKYKSEKSPFSLTKEEALIKFRIESISDYLKKQIFRKFYKTNYLI